MSKKKTLAQLSYPSKEWDDEKERQEPGWGSRNAATALLLSLPQSEARLSRVRGYLDAESKRKENNAEKQN